MNENGDGGVGEKNWAASDALLPIGQLNVKWLF
jgi:hypothetical protein